MIERDLRRQFIDEHRTFRPRPDKGHIAPQDVHQLRQLIDAGATKEIAGNDLPLYPLWYPSNMVIATKRIGNIKINASGDWSFIKDLSLSN